jgi:hypothetical protein
MFCSLQGGPCQLNSIAIHRERERERERTMCLWVIMSSCSAVGPALLDPIIVVGVIGSACSAPTTAQPLIQIRAPTAEPVVLGPVGSLLCRKQLVVDKQLPILSPARLKRS